MNLYLGHTRLSTMLKGNSPGKVSLTGTGALGNKAESDDKRPVSD